MAQTNVGSGRLTDPAAVRRAMAECDAVGREAFLQQHGFGRASRYVLVHDGREYDSKAIANVALAYQAGSAEVLTSPRLHGGKNHAARLLHRLGFLVLDTSEEGPDADPPLGRFTADYIAMVKSLDGPLDRHGRATRRVEQALLRGALGLYESPTNGCDLCDRELPVSLLVAAHIKPRSQCTPDERRDVPHVVMRACLLGCDALFERRLLTVHADGRLAVGADVGHTAVEQHLVALVGRLAPGFTQRRSPYFAWRAGPS